MTYAATVLADNPAIYWRLGESAPPALDSSPNGRDDIAGTFTPMSGLLVGDPNGAVSSGPGDLVAGYGGGPDFLAALPGITVEVWVRRTPPADSSISDATVATISAAFGGAGIVFDYPTATDLTADFRTEEAPATIVVVTAAGAGWGDGGIHHLVATADGGAGRLYMDGALLGSTPLTGTFAASVFYLLQSDPGVATFDEVALYGHALTAGQVAAHYAAGTTGGPGPPAPASPAGTIGAAYTAVSPTGAQTVFHPSIDATLSSDLGREIRRTVDGLVLIPSEAAKVDLVADQVAVALVVDGIAHPMGRFYFTEDSLAENAVTDDAGDPADLTHASLGDRFARLRAATEYARVAYAGTDPSAVMIEVLTEAGLPHSVTGSFAPFAVDVVWAAGTTLEAIVSQCAEVAGHRRPWADNDGVIRSVAANVIDTDVIPLADLGPLAGSVVITNTRLFTPNRVLVFDDQAVVPTTGTWDAPASAPNSAVKRGWVQTLVVAQQGLSGAGHAQAVAETIGERLGARSLAAVIRPTWRLDGPVILSHRGAYWMVVAWSVGLGPTATMSLDAIEVLVGTAAPDTPWGGGGGGAGPAPGAPSAYMAAVLADSPEIYWRLGDTASPALDSSGNGRDSDDLGSGAFTSVAGLLLGDPANGAARTTSPADFVAYYSTSPADWMTAAAGITIECWVAGTSKLRVQAESGGFGHARLWPGSPNAADVSGIFRTVEAGAAITVTATAAGWDDGGPHHLVATADGTTIEIYMDGVAIASGAAPVGTYVCEDFYALMYDPPSAVFDEVAIYSHALSAARVTAHYAAGNTP